MLSELIDTLSGPADPNIVYLKKYVNILQKQTMTFNEILDNMKLNNLILYDTISKQL